MNHGELIRMLCIRLKSILDDNNNNNAVYKTFQSTPEQIYVRKNPNGRYIRITTEGVLGRGRLVMEVLSTNIKSVLYTPFSKKDFSMFFDKVRASIDMLCSQAGKG